MNKINIHHISVTKGLDLTLNQKDEWFLNLIKRLIPEHRLDPNSLVGQFNFLRTNTIVDVMGSISFTHYPPCDRCATEIKSDENISFSTHLSPASLVEDKKKRGAHGKTPDNETEIELHEDELDHCFYHNEEIDLEPLINDEVALSIRYNYYCTPAQDCKIPVPNQEYITVNDTSDPRWAPLVKLKNTKPNS
ncbi:MAG TPA: DUF177 domain-containing protein [bacterium]|nr:DUF177 domain-containing protein [bacterium]